MPKKAPRKRLYLHIGTQKTGTTSFQDVMQSNRAQCQKDGLYVHTSPNIKGKLTANCVQFSHAVLRNDLKTLARMSDEADRAGLLQMLGEMWNLRRQLKQSNCNRGVISSEAFCFCRTPSERRRLKLMFAGFDVQVIVVFRNDTDWRESWINQLANVALQNGFPMSATFPLSAPWYFDKPEIVEFWSFFGDPIVIDYDKEMKYQGSVLPALFQSIGASAISLPAGVFLNKRT